MESHLLKTVRIVLFIPVVCVMPSKLWEVPSAPLAQHANLSTRLFWEPKCQAHLRQLQMEGRITAMVPPKLEGHWVSSRALQHYYSESECQIPTYSLMIKGKLRLRQASWITPGATEAEHQLHKVGIVIHSQKAAHHLATRFQSSCLGLKAEGHLVPRRFYELFNAKADKDCLGVLGFSMMELELLRVETHHHTHSRPAQELFLGDIHTDWEERVHHRPTSYQDPLQNAMHHIHPCPVCGLVYRASEQHPPILPPSRIIPLKLHGNWVSQRCESHPALLFLTRLFRFNEEQRTWEGTYQHYSDPLCLQPSFTLSASGHFIKVGQSFKVRGATELIFKVTRAKLTVFDRALLRELNSSDGRCGGAGHWVAGIEQDITWTNGCEALGIRLPHKEYELFKMELDYKGRSLLFNGERATDGSSPDGAAKRATSFQVPMVQCNTSVGVKPHHSAYKDHSTPSEKSSADALYSSLILLVALNVWNILKY
ncbi:hypothetical protein DNTS_003407 [Danionella cerebrum]|uniref:APCDD1 domain-containing protein n=1 Tax=Danionella cerebrum TaxID=2873325 RepID=A0A553PR58_9TELE|nr:hypothetical protein DNTS_003407 [Danionella translucida]